MLFHQENAENEFGQFAWPCLGFRITTTKGFSSLSK